MTQVPSTIFFAAFLALKNRTKFSTITFETAYVGTAKTIPSTPARFPATNRIMMIVAGCVSNVFPNINGDRKFPSICWATRMTTITNKAFVGESNKATSTAGVPPMIGPT